MPVGLERAPVYPFNDGALTHRSRNSIATLDVILAHDEWVIAQLGLESDAPFKAGADALRARSEQLKNSKSEAHCKSRTVHELGLLVTGTVKQMDAEFAGEKVLDIGCGEGNYGKELSRNVKARVTFLDRDEVALTGITRKSGRKAVAEGYSLPFKDESFAKTVSAYSSIPWAETPLEALHSLQEALRVTQVDGTFFAIPLVQNVFARHNLARQESLNSMIDQAYNPQVDPQALKVWNLQDHLLINSLLTFAEDGYCAITWSNFIGEGVRTGVTSEHYSAIIDKLQPIPAEVFANNLAYAGKFISDK